MFGILVLLKIREERVFEHGKIPRLEVIVSLEEGKETSESEEGASGGVKELKKVNTLKLKGLTHYEFPI